MVDRYNHVAIPYGPSVNYSLHIRIDAFFVSPSICESVLLCLMNVVSSTSTCSLKSCCDHSIPIVHYDVFSQAGFMLSVFVFKVAWWHSG